MTRTSPQGQATASAQHHNSAARRTNAPLHISAHPTVSL
jgi:hypothetical protein